MRSYLDLFIISVVSLVVYNELLFNGYLGYLDATTIPSFVNLPSPLYILTGVSNSPPFFSINLNPGLSLLEFLFQSLLSNYWLNFFYFFYLLMYSLGLWYLLRNITDNKFLVTLGTLIGFLNPGVFIDVSDSPTTLYIAPIPWFLAFYFRYRTKGLKKDLIYSFAPLSVLGVYGPPIPVLILSLVAVEIYIWFTSNPRPRVRSLSLPFIILSIFTLFHVNVVYLVLHPGQQLYSIEATVNDFFQGPIYERRFNLVQILLMDASFVKINFFSTIQSLLPYDVMIIYIFLTLVLLSMLFTILIQRRKFFPLIFLVLAVALMGYENNYLGLFSLIHATIPIFSGVDPPEYQPLVGLFMALGIANLNGIKGGTKFLAHLVILISLVMVIVNGVVMGLSYSIIWHHVNVPEPYIQAYKSLYNSSGGEIFIIPPLGSFHFSFYKYNGFLANEDPVPSYFPASFFEFSSNQVVVAQTKGPYLDFYYYILSDNSSGASRLASMLDIEKILIVTNLSYSEGIYNINTFNSSEINNISTLYNLTLNNILYIPAHFNASELHNFKVIFNESGLIVLQYQNLTAFKIETIWDGLKVYPKNDTVVLPPISSFYVMGGKTMAINGTVIVNSHHKNFIVSSTYVWFNLITEGLIAGYWIFLIGYVLKYRLKKVLFV